MNGVQFPAGWYVELLSKAHNRRKFSSGHLDVDRWFKQTAFQSQKKHLTVTKVLLDATGSVAGFYSLATSQIDFSDLPPEISKSLPKRLLPVAVLAWFGVDYRQQGQGIGKRLLATALRDCYEASDTFAFIAVILDCIDTSAKHFYRQFHFAELPGYPLRLFVPFRLLKEMMHG
ncbi:MAG: GNAT family N-acetyltransferase [Planctomycetales bacterium]|nr:GNAT family N-acetyltransferase [Planctomycetales bacterium]